MNVFKKRLRGSILLVLVYGFIMSFVMLGFLRLGIALSVGSRDSATIYSSIQTYRTMSELCCYQYLNALEAAVVQKDLDADWLSVTNRAIYTQAITAILETYEDSAYAGTGSSWVVHDIKFALDTAAITNASFIDDLVDELGGGIQDFTLILPEPMKIDPLSTKSYQQARRAYLELSPFQIDVTVNVKGETIVDHFIVANLFLLVQEENTYMGDGSTHMIATLSFVEGDEGCDIYRTTGAGVAAEVS